MLVLRLIGALVLITLAVVLLMYFFTRNRSYLTFGWRVFQFAFIFVIVFMLLYLLERLVFII
jgi:hypothetical protein